MAKDMWGLHDGSSPRPSYYEQFKEKNAPADDSTNYVEKNPSPKRYSDPDEQERTDKEAAMRKRGEELYNDPRYADFFLSGNENDPREGDGVRGAGKLTAEDADAIRWMRANGNMKRKDNAHEYPDEEPYEVCNK